MREFGLLLAAAALLTVGPSSAGAESPAAPAPGTSLEDADRYRAGSAGRGKPLRRLFRSVLGAEPEIVEASDKAPATHATGPSALVTAR